MQSFENIKQAEIIVEFRDGSIMSTLEVSHLAVKMIEMKDVTWKLDLRECSIGTCTWGAVDVFGGRNIIVYAETWIY